jgi:hypothetical protein
MIVLWSSMYPVSSQSTWFCDIANCPDDGVFFRLAHGRGQDKVAGNRVVRLPVFHIALGKSGNLFLAIELNRRAAFLEIKDGWRVAVTATVAVVAN